MGFVLIITHLKEKIKNAILLTYKNLKPIIYKQKIAGSHIFCKVETSGFYMYPIRFSFSANIIADYYNTMYDDVIIPPELIGVHYKAAIKARNRWMIDNSDVVMVYTIRDYGGAFDAMKYAIKNGRNVIKI